MKKVTGIICWLLVATQAFCQAPSKREIDLAITTIADLVKEKYVFPEKGEKIAQRLADSLNNGFFRKVKSWPQFETLCSELMRTISQDNHMYVKYDSALARDLKLRARAPVADQSDLFYRGDQAERKNFGFTEVRILPGNIGWLRIDEINISEKSLPVLHAAMEFVSRTDALVLDLRYNGGGGSAVGGVLESYFLDGEMALLEFHSDVEGGSMLTTVPKLAKFVYQKPLFILIGKQTASAAEAVAYVLQHQQRATIIGQQSAGAAHMNSFYPLDDKLVVSISTGAPTIPGTSLNWEGRGVTPDHNIREGDELDVVRKTLSDQWQKSD